MRLLGRLGSNEKKALLASFNISEATLSRDQASFLAQSSDDVGIQIEKGKLTIARTAESSLERHPEEPSIDAFLRVMLGAKLIEMTGSERVSPAEHIVGKVVRSIHDRRVLRVRYLSRNATSEPAWRLISPHAVVNIAGRYHARCYDHEKVRYGDFVLTRMLDVDFQTPEILRYKDAWDDVDWATRVSLKVSAKESANLDILRMDYGLGESGFKVVHTRKALSPYLIDARLEGFDSLVEIKMETDSGRLSG